MSRPLLASQDDTPQLNTECPDLIEVSNNESLHMSGLSFDEECHFPRSPSRSVGNMTCSTVSSISSTKSVGLMAPADLPAGYQFVAKIGDDEECVVEVSGTQGVRSGQLFLATVIREGSSRLRAQPGHNIPFGRWRDSLFHCFRHGISHSVIFMALCCTPLLLAQVMTRMGLNAFGRHAESTTEKNPSTGRFSQSPILRIFSLIFLLHFVLIETALSAIVVSQIHAREEGTIARVPTWAYVLLAVRAVCRTTLVVYVATISIRTRRYVRERYAIPESKRVPDGIEDALVSLACFPCGVAQMARHTADYDKYDAQSCSPTGLSTYAPLPV